MHSPFPKQSCWNLEITFLPNTFVFNFEFEGHAVEYGDEIWRQKIRIMGGGLPYGEDHDRRSNHVGTVNECERQTDGQTYVQIYDD